MLTREQLIKNIESLEKQGASQDEVQEYINSVSTKGPADDGQSVLGGVAQGVVQGVSRLPLKAFSSLVANPYEGISNVVKEGISRLPGQEDFDYTAATQEQNRKNVEGRDFGYFGKVPVFGSQLQDKNLTATEQAIRGGVGIAGDAAEAASYFFAPKLGSGGIWGTVKNSAQNIFTKNSVLFGLGMGAQEYANSGDLSKAATTGAGSAVFNGIGIGLMHGGGRFMGYFGNRLLSSPGFNSAYKQVGKTLQETGVLASEYLAAPARLAEQIRQSEGFKGIYNYVNDQYSRNVGNLVNASIDTLYPSASRDVGLMMRDFQRRAAASISGMYKTAQSYWNRLDTPDFRVSAGEEAMPSTYSVINKVSAGADASLERLIAANPANASIVTQLRKQGMESGAILENLRLMGQAVPESEYSNPFMRLLGDVQKRLQTGELTPKDAGALANEVLDRARNLQREEAAMARRLGIGLLDDAENQITAAGRTDILDIWNQARNASKRASDVYDSSIMKAIRDAGGIEKVLSKTLNKEGSSDVSDIVRRMFEENPQETRDLFMSAVFDQVRRMMRPTPGGDRASGFREAAKFIDSFLARRGTFSWADNVIQGSDATALSEISRMLKRDIDTSLSLLRKVYQDETAMEKAVYENLMIKGRLDAVEALKTGNVDEFSDILTDLINNHPDTIKPFIEAMTPTNKQLASVTILKELFTDSLELYKRDADGNIKISDQMFDAFETAYQRIQRMQQRSGSDTVFGIFSKDQMKQMEKTAQIISDLRKSQNYNPRTLRNFWDAMIGGAFAAQGWLHGAFNRFSAIMKEDPKIQEEARLAVARLTEQMSENNKVVLVGDMLQAIGPIFTKALVANGYRPEYEGGEVEKQNAGN